MSSWQRQPERVFQSSPSPKAGSYVPFDFVDSSSWKKVSILSQPEGRELLSFPIPFFLTLLFQSSPSPKAGSYMLILSGWSMFLGFNPLPARRPGATIAVGTKITSFHVSILSQPEGRELQRSKHYLSPAPKFQSSPSPKAGSYHQNNRIRRQYPWFQSSPSPKAGSYSSEWPFLLR